MLSGSVHETRAKYVTFVGNRKYDNAWIVVGVSISKGAVQRTVIRVHVLKEKKSIFTGMSKICHMSKCVKITYSTWTLVSM